MQRFPFRLPWRQLEQWFECRGLLVEFEQPSLECEFEYRVPFRRFSLSEGVSATRLRPVRRKTGLFPRLTGRKIKLLVNQLVAYGRTVIQSTHFT